MEFSFYGHAFFYYIRVFLFHDGGTIIGIYLLDLYVLTFHDMGYGTRALLRRKRIRRSLTLTR